jgi:chlorobactene glucosyltransferase
MTILAYVFIVLGGLACLVWTSRHIMVNIEKRKGFELEGSYAGPPTGAPFISVLVAAKDEQDNIETCVRTMLSQDYPAFELIVCNDRSTDRTAAIVEEIAKQDSRVRLVNIESLPTGWFGKNNAMQTGIKLAKGDWICMIDADCRQTSNRTLSVAMQYAFNKRADMLSVLPSLEMKTFWEFVIQPVCSGVMMIWFHPDKVNNPAKPNAYANGAFMLMSRQTYQAIGTHQAVRQCLNEDMHMARITKEKGMSLRVVRGPSLCGVRMYTSFNQMLKGWSRIFLGTFGTLKRLSISLTVMVVMGLLPYVEAAVGLTTFSLSSSPSCLWLASGLLGLAAAMLQLTVIYRFYRLVGARPGLAWTYPIGSIIVIVALIMSLSRLRKGSSVVWRGSTCTTTKA